MKNAVNNISITDKSLFFDFIKFSLIPVPCKIF